MNTSKFLLSKRTYELPESIFAKLFHLAETQKEIISLGPGEPDFDTPKHVIEASKKYLDKGFTHYSSSQGRPELIEEIGKKLKKENKINLSDPQKQVIVTCGSTEALLLSYMTVTDVTEEIIVPNPGFLAYKPGVEFIDGVPVDLNLNEEDGFQVNPDELTKLISPKTRGIIVNTPSNPTGTVLKKKLLEEIADIAVEKNLMIFSDEAYEKFVFGKGKHYSIGSFNGMENNVVTLQSFSKTYAMPGFRVGYAAGPEWMIKEMTHTHIYSTLSAPTISQLAAFTALKDKRSIKSIEAMRKEYERRNKLITKRISEIDKLHMSVKPEGAFYAFPKFDSKMNSIEFTEWLIKHAGVIAIPGTEFGTNGEGLIRFSYATQYSLIEKAMNKIEEALKKLK